LKQCIYQGNSDKDIPIELLERLEIVESPFI